MAIEAFIRFLSPDNETHYGAVTQGDLSNDLHGLSVPLLSGDPFTPAGFTLLPEHKTIKKVLCPLESTPIILCIGLNYRKHATETGLTIPDYPVVFTKPADALTGPYDDISIHPITQSQLDYEGELCFVVGKDCKNVRKEEAMDYVLGYNNGIDVSARNFMTPSSSGGQFCYAKSFDQFAPIGPAIVLTASVIDPLNLDLTTKVNDEVRQSDSTSDLIWNIGQILEHLTRGTTVRKGTVIMTGTPPGVGMFMSPPQFLSNGDVVEIGIEGLGALRNKFVFEK